VLGLHDRTTVVVVVGLIIVVLAAVGMILLARAGREVAGIAFTPVAFFGVVGLACLGGWLYYAESSLDQRDAAIVVRLETAGVHVVDFRGDQRVIVQRDGCIAAYQIQTSVDLREESGVWPLVGGTGEAIRGCTDKQLDKKFIPE
jgi:hypothetical protein